MARKIGLIVSDIDGTILTSEHEVDNQLAQAVKALGEKNIPFALASARSPHGMFPIAKELALGNNPIACYNGALIIKGQAGQFETLIEHGMNKADIAKIIKIVQSDFPHIAINLYSADRWLVEKKDKWVETEAWITKEKPELISLKTILQDAKTPVHKLLLIAEPKEIQDFLAFTESQTFQDVSFYLSKDNYLEVTSRSVSKENALLELANYFEVPLQNTLAIGDNFNDIPMLKRAGLGVAMGNAPREVQEAADVKTQSHNENGVSKAIETYVL